MNKRFSLVAAALILSSATFVSAQTTTTTVTQTPTTVTKTVQHPDGTFTVIEYPVKKEVTVTLNPVGMAGANGVATILRDDNGTRIKLNLTGVPRDSTGLNLYAVDPAGVTTLLGPITVTDGVGTFTTTTQLDKFMLIASPDAGLTAYDPNTTVMFRSAVPEGFAVIPHTMHPIGEKVAATSTPGVTPTTSYSVPMLNIPAYKKGDDTQLKVDLTGELTGSRVNFKIEPRHDGPTTVTARFHQLKESSGGKVYVLWAVSSDNKYVKLGQVVNTGRRNEAEIKSETTLKDFGLFITLEDELSMPRGTVIGTVNR